MYFFVILSTSNVCCLFLKYQQRCRVDSISRENGRGRPHTLGTDLRLSVLLFVKNLLLFLLAVYYSHALPRLVMIYGIVYSYTTNVSGVTSSTDYSPYIRVFCTRILKWGDCNKVLWTCGCALRRCVYKTEVVFVLDQTPSYACSPTRIYHRCESEHSDYPCLPSWVRWTVREPSCSRPSWASVLRLVLRCQKKSSKAS